MTPASFGFRRLNFTGPTIPQGTLLARAAASEPKIHIHDLLLRFARHFRWSLFALPRRARCRLPRRFKSTPLLFGKRLFRRHADAFERRDPLAGVVPLRRVDRRPGLTAAARDSPMAGAPTLCRFENRATPDRARAMHEVLAQTFLAARPTPPEEIVPDIDATDDAAPGRQAGRFFHGCHDCHCFLPLCVLAGDHLPVAWLRPANVDGAGHAGAITKLPIARWRREWPGTRFVIRADSGFCRRRLLSWCDRNGVDCIIGLPRNPRLTRLVAPETAEAERAFTASGRKRFHFAGRFRGAGSWNRKRRVIARIRHGPGGARPALHRHQPEGRVRGALQKGLAPARREGEPDQGETTATPRRPPLPP